MSFLWFESLQLEEKPNSVLIQGIGAIMSSTPNAILFIRAHLKSNQMPLALLKLSPLGF